MVAMGGVVADMDGPVRATAHLPDYCFVGKDVFLRLVIDNRRNTTHYVVMEVMSNAKFDFVGEGREVKREERLKLQGGLSGCTVIGARMSLRKWRETKQKLI